MLSFTSWTLTPVLRFEEVLQYLELELGTQDMMWVVLPSAAQQSAHRESSDVGTLQWSPMTMQTVPWWGPLWKYNTQERLILPNEKQLSNEHSAKSLKY